MCSTLGDTQRFAVPNLSVLRLENEILQLTVLFLFLVDLK